MENKKEFVKSLENLVKETNTGCDVSSLDIEEKGDDTFVKVTFNNGYSRMVDVTCDSCAAIAVDVIQSLY